MLGTVYVHVAYQLSLGLATLQFKSRALGALQMNMDTATVFFSFNNSLHGLSTYSRSSEPSIQIHVDGGITHFYAQSLPFTVVNFVQSDALSLSDDLADAGELQVVGEEVAQEERVIEVKNVVRMRFEGERKLILV